MNSALRLYAWNLKYAAALVGDLTDVQCTEPGGPGLENHPAWTIGHLVTGSDMLAEDLGLERELSKEWRELFERRGPGDPRVPDPARDAYPPMTTLLAELERQHARVELAWRTRLDARGESTELDVPIEWRFGDMLPSLGDATMFLAVTHEAMHLGQLASWRRARGLPSALNSL